jgi:hypothetical protein
MRADAAIYFARVYLALPGGMQMRRKNDSFIEGQADV